MNTKAVVVVLLTAAVIVVGYKISNLDWRTNEEKLAAEKVNYQEELSHLEEIVEASGIASEALVQVSSKEVIPINEETTSTIEETRAASEETVGGDTEDVTDADEGPDTGPEVVSVVTEETTSPKPTAAASESEGNEVKDAFMQEKIDENRGQINQEDLVAGAAIYNRLDTLYLLDLMDGGLTALEEVQLGAYLDTELTPEEKVIVLKLINKYTHLID